MMVTVDIRVTLTPEQIAAAARPDSIVWLRPGQALDEVARQLRDLHTKRLQLYPERKRP